MMLLILLAQAPELEDPYTRYFSFFILGLVMTIGYAWYRLSQRKERTKSASLEEQLLEAEREARRLQAQRKQAEEGISGLELTPEQELERARLKKLATPPPAVDGDPIPPQEHPEQTNNDTEKKPSV